jgi:hypothetical protein
VRLKPARALTAIGAAAGAAVAIGVALAALNGTSFGFFGFLIAFGVGVAMAEVVTRTSGHYRGRESGAIAAGGSILAYVVAWQAVPLLYAHQHLATNWVTLQFVFGIVAAVVAYRRVA